MDIPFGIIIAVISFLIFFPLGWIIDRRYGHYQIDDNPMIASFCAIPFIVLMVVYMPGFLSYGAVFIYLISMLIVFLLVRNKLSPVEKGGNPNKYLIFFVIPALLFLVYCLVAVFLFN